MHLGTSTAASMASSNIEPHPESFVFCDNYSEDLVRFFCNVCEVSLCQQCWDTDHVDWKTHKVSMIRVNLEPQKQIERSLSEYKTECDKLNSLFSSNDWNMMHQKVQTAEKEQKLILKMNSVKQAETKSETDRTLLSSHKASFQDFKKKVLSQFEVMERKYATIFCEKLEDCYQEDIESVCRVSGLDHDEQLSEGATSLVHQPSACLDKTVLHQSTSRQDGSECKTDGSPSTMTTENTDVRLKRKRSLVGVIKSKIGDEKFAISFKACYNTYTREIFCMTRNPFIVLVFEQTEIDKFEKTREMNWRELRGDSDELLDLELDKNNNLYLSIRSKNNDSKNRVEIVNTKNLQTIRAINTNGIINGRVYWFLYAKNETMLLAVHDSRSPKDRKWCDVTVYRNEIKQCTIPISISFNDVPLPGDNVMLNDSTLLMTSGWNCIRLALVSLPSQCITPQTSPESNFEHQHQSTRQPVHVKFFTLDGSNTCENIIWMPSTSVNSSSSLDGFCGQSVSKWKTEIVGN